MTTLTLGLFRQYVAAAIAAIATLIMGTMAAWPSPVLKAIKEKGKPMKLTNSEISWMVSLLYLGNFLSPFPSGWLMDKFGRKTSLICLTILPLMSWILTYLAKSAQMLYIARLLAGMWTGVVTTILPMYLAEIAEPKVRGSLGTFLQMSISIGVCLIYIIGPSVTYRWLALICGLIPVFFLGVFFFMPESPYWLLAVGQTKKAAHSLKWLRGQEYLENINSELEFTKKTVKVEMEKKQGQYFKDLFKSRSNRKALLISSTLGVMQRLSGSSVLTAFASVSLPPQGAGRLSINDCVIVFGCASIVSVLAAAFIIDSTGRKPLLIISSFGCGLAMLGAGIWFFLDEKTDSDVKDVYYIPFICYMAYAVAFCIGLGPIPTIIQGELFPSYIRGVASAIISELTAIASLVINKLFIPIGDSVGLYLNYWIYAANCIGAMIFTIFFVIETKKKTFFEIQEQLK